MAKKLKITAFLFLAAAAGFYFGLKNRNVEVMVRREGTAAAEKFLFQGNQFMPDDLSDISGGMKPSALWWYVARASGLCAYLLMFVIIVWGMGMTTGFTYKITNPVKAWTIHKYMNVSLGALILAHAGGLLMDDYIKFDSADVFVPFASDFKPLYLSLGIIGFYILTAVILSSLLVRLKMPRFWRALHHLVYPLFAASLIHGAFIGTDSETLTMKAIYWTTGAAFAVLLYYRFAVYRLKQKEE